MTTAYVVHAQQLNTMKTKGRGLQACRASVVLSSVRMMSKLRQTFWGAKAYPELS